MKAGLVIVLLLLNTATALGVVNNQYKKRLAIIEMTRLENMRDDMIDKWSQLLVEYAAWSANSRIERIATEQLNMKHTYADYLYLNIGSW